jgi:hypothetical protein
MNTIKNFDSMYQNAKVSFFPLQRNNKVYLPCIIYCVFYESVSHAHIIYEIARIFTEKRQRRNETFHFVLFWYII